MRINTNTAAMNTYSNLTSANASKSGSLAKLSSGLRINKAGDDAAGLAISEKMKNQISGMTQASRNAQDGISLIQTAEGALTETHSMLNRMRDLTVQAANGTNTNDDRKSIQLEIKSLTEEVSRVADNTKFNGEPLLNEGVEAVENRAFDQTKLTAMLSDKNATTSDDTTLTEATSNASKLRAAIGNVSGADMASVDDMTKLTTELGKLDADQLKDVISEYNVEKRTGSDLLTNEGIRADSASVDKEFSFQIGANSGDKISVSIKDMTSEALLNITDIDNLAASGFSVENSNNIDSMLTTIDTAIGKVSSQRATLGATQNRLDHTVSNLATTKENLSEANSRITDVDMAEEMMSFTKSNILSQASTSMLAQANQMPQSVLSLLQ